MADDVVAALDAELALIELLPYRVPIHHLAQRARDEIVHLREIAARPSPELHALSKERDEARDAALEEAAQVCIRLVRGFPQCGIAASAIRKLKDKG